MERSRSVESLSSILLLPSLLSIALSSCGDRSGPADEAGPAPASSASDSGFRAVSAQESGIRFANRLTETLQFNFMRYPYIYSGGGVATGDFDYDGLRGDGAGGFTPVMGSGLLTEGNVKRIEVLEIQGRTRVVVVANDGPLLLYRPGR